MHTHSLFWHTIHYLPLILIVASFVVAAISKKFTNLKKYLALFASVGVSAHLMDNGFEFHNGAEPCFLYVAVLSYVFSSYFKTFLVSSK